VTFHAEASIAQVRNAPDTSTGGATEVVVSAEPRRDLLVRFESSASEGFEHPRVRLRMLDAAPGSTVRAGLAWISESGWDERSTTWASSAAITANIGAPKVKSITGIPANGGSGTAASVTIEKDNTTVVGGKGEKTDITARVNQIKAQIESTTSDYDREKLQERLAKLSGGVAVLYVGAATEVEMKEKKDRVDDAIHATRAAVEEGIVPGGGVAYIRATDALQT